MSVVFKLADHPRRRALTEKLTKLRDGLCAGLSSDEICQQEIERETAIISKAMDRLADYASKSRMVDVVEGLLERKAGGVK
jgi:hypothetical protein